MERQGFVHKWAGKDVEDATGEAELRPYKSLCTCGKWFYVLGAHIECANAECHPDIQYHDDYARRMMHQTN